MKGTRKIHQFFTNPLADQKILHYQFLHLCKHYLELNLDNCAYVTKSLLFSISSHLLCPSSHDFSSHVSEERGVILLFEHSSSQVSEIVHFEIFSCPQENQLAQQFFGKFNLLLFFLIS